MKFLSVNTNRVIAAFMCAVMTAAPVAQAAAVYQFQLHYPGMAGPGLSSGGGAGALDPGSNPTGSGSGGGSSGGNSGTGTGGAGAGGAGTTNPSKASLAFNPGLLSFGVHESGSDATLTATLTNSSDVPATGLTLTPGTSAYSLTGTTCGTALAPAASCTVTVGFSAAVPGAYSSTFLASSPDAAAPASLVLSGNVPQAVPPAPGPILQFNPTSLDFGSQVLGASHAYSATLTNTGNQPASFTGIGLSAGAAHFAQTNDCGASLAAGAFCTVHVAFTATTIAPEFGIVFAALTNGPSASLDLTGSGQGAVLSASPTAVDFGTVAVSGNSYSAIVTLRNAGNVPLTQLAASVTGAGYAVNTASCGSTLAPNASCNASLTFTPTTSGPVAGSATFSGAGNTPLTVTLTGNGSQAHLALSQTSLAFGSIEKGSTAPVQVVTVSNTGNEAATLSGISVTDGMANFAQTNGCGTSLAAGASCNISVNFTPSVASALTGTVAVAAAGFPPLGVSLSGTGVTAELNASPAPVTFGLVAPTGGPVSQAVTLRNTGTSATTALTVGLSTGVPFTLTANNCAGAVLAPQASCSVTVVFTPTVADYTLHNDALTFTAGALSKTVVLSAQSRAPDLTVSPSTLDLGTANVGALSAVKTITVSNPSAAPALITTLGVLGNPQEFAQNNTCGSTLAAGAFCEITVQMKPAAGGARVGSLVVDSAAGPVVISLAGSGTAPVAALDASAGSATVDEVGTLHYNITFADTVVGSSSAVRSIKLSNTGNGPLQVLGTSTSSGTTANFGATDNCGSSIAPGSFCTISLLFTPSAMGAQTGSLTVASDNGVFILALSGKGLQSVATLTSSASLTLPEASLGGAAAAGTWTFRNDGNMPMSLVVSTATSPFTFSNLCGNIAAGATCSIGVSMAATANGSFSQTGVALTGASVGNRSDLSVSGTVRGSVVVASSNTANALTAVAAQAAGTGTVTFTNSGNADATLTLSGLSAPYSLSASSCAAAANGGTCSVTVTMATNGATGAQGAQTLTVAGATSGSFSVPISGTLAAQNTLQVMDLSNAALSTVAFGTVASDTTITFRLANASSSRSGINVSGVTATGSSTPFSVTAVAATAGNLGATCTSSSNMTLPPGKSCDITVKFTSTAGVYNTGYALAISSTAELLTPSALGTASSFSLPVTGIATVAPGSQNFLSAGTTSFVVPAGVTSISAVTVGAGGGGSMVPANGRGGGGGALAYVNDIPVTPGETLTVVVGAAGQGNMGTATTAGGFTAILRGSTELVGAGGGAGGKNTVSVAGGAVRVGTGFPGGGTLAVPNGSNVVTGGGGAGGYTGNGGTGGSKNNAGSGNTNTAGAGGGGGGGLSQNGTSGASGGGGGTGIFGAGTSGAAGTTSGGGAAGGGSTLNGTGTAGTGGGTSNAPGGAGGFPGGGGGASNNSYSGGNGGGGAARIIWGAGRAFPSTGTATP